MALEVSYEICAERKKHENDLCFGLHGSLISPRMGGKLDDAAYTIHPLCLNADRKGLAASHAVAVHTITSIDR